MNISGLTQPSKGYQLCCTQESQSSYEGIVMSIVAIYCVLGGDSHRKEIDITQSQELRTAHRQENPNLDIADSELGGIENSVGNSRLSYIFASRQRVKQ